MHNFEYAAPTSVAEAVQILSKHNGSAKPLAGGTDLIDQIRLGRHKPAVVVDIKKIPELSTIELSAQGLKVGAAVPCYKIYGHEGICSQYSALADSTRIIGGIQIQSRASLGGNLCNSGPAADSTPSLIALGGKAVIASASGSREIPIEQFCTGPGQNILKAGEFLVQLVFPARPKHSGSHYRRFIPRNEMDIAVVGVGASVVLDDKGETIVSGRISLGAVAATPLFAKQASDLLAGQPANEATLEKAAAAAQAIAKPIDDMRGTKEFRIHLTGVITRRVLQEAIDRARKA